MSPLGADEKEQRTGQPDGCLGVTGMSQFPQGVLTLLPMQPML